MPCSQGVFTTSITSKQAKFITKYEDDYKLTLNLNNCCYSGFWLCSFLLFFYQKLYRFCHHHRRKYLNKYCFFFHSVKCIGMYVIFATEVKKTLCSPLRQLSISCNKKTSIVSHASTVESVHCTRDIQRELGVRGHDLLLMLGSCSGRAILYSVCIRMIRRKFCMFHPPMV